MLSLKEKAAKNFINAIGWNSKQKYVLIESDDWGAVRMPSRAVYDELVLNNIPVDKLHIDKLDSVESNDDLERLYETLKKFKDAKGNHPVITAYAVVANPNFEKIEACNRQVYHYETILDTYSRSAHTDRVPELIKQGIAENIFVPQFHGREHVHVKRYMEAINSDSEKEQIAFNSRAIISSYSSTCPNPYLPDYFKGFDYITGAEHTEIESIHRDGLQLFKEIFGFPSISFTAQGSVWGDHLLEMLAEQDVKFIGGQQQNPDLQGGYKTVNKYWGSVNKYNQMHWRRNCRFEPARDVKFDWVNYCLTEMQIAFRWGKPAVISSHRENFTGSIFEENRNDSLKKLEMLLAGILKRWPDVEFISTAQLAEIMLAEKK